MNAQLRNSIVAIVLSTVIGALLFWPWGGVATEADEAPGIEPREYEIWLSAIFRPSFSKDRPNIVLLPRAGSIEWLPREHLAGIGELMIAPGGARGSPKSPRISPEDYERAREAVADFARKNSRQWKIEQKFGDVPELQIAESRLPDTDELVEVSRVGFSTDGSIAVVDWSSRRDSRSGTGGLLVMKLVDGAWKVVGIYGGWKS